MAKQQKQKQNFPSIVESIWWVGFSDAEGPVKWWDLFTRKGFRHIYIYAEIEGRVIVYVMTRGGLVTLYLNMDGMDPTFSVHEYLKKEYSGNIIVPVKGRIETGKSMWRLSPFTCVELARSLLGIRRMVFTPYGLYKYVIKKNMVAGTVVQDPDSVVK